MTAGGISFGIVVFWFFFPLIHSSCFSLPSSMVLFFAAISACFSLSLFSCSSIVAFFSPVSFFNLSFSFLVFFFFPFPPKQQVTPQLSVPNPPATQVLLGWAGGYDTLI